MFKKKYMGKSAVYASLDIESDGNNPMQYSMRSIGISLFLEGSNKVFDTFYRTILPRPGTCPEEKCMTNFWKKNLDQWNHVNENPSTPSDVMYDLSKWLKFHDKTLSVKWVASPANFDWMFLKCYYELFAPPETKYDIGFFCHDLSSLLRAYIVMHKISDSQSFKKDLSENALYNHNALDDSICQGVMYMNLRKLLEYDVLEPENKEGDDN